MVFFAVRSSVVFVVVDGLAAGGFVRCCAVHAICLLFPYPSRSENAPHSFICLCRVEAGERNCCSPKHRSKFARTPAERERSVRVPPEEAEELLGEKQSNQLRKIPSGCGRKWVALGELSRATSGDSV